MNEKVPHSDYEDTSHPMYHIPLPSNQLHNSMSDISNRSRSESNGQQPDRIRSRRSSASEDRIPLTTFFGTQAWQRLSTVLPQGVRDPLNIHELEREECQMPFTQVSVGAMGRGDIEQQMIIPLGHSTGNEKQANPNNPPAQLIDWEYMQDHNLRTGGLPSLDQVLTRRTRAPLALRDFAVHCSVRQPQARRWLEFYMAARTHEKMCLAYESDLRQAKSRSQYASTDSRLIPQLSKVSQSVAATNEDKKYDPNQREAAHNRTMESLSKGLGGGNASENKRDSDFRRNRRQSTRMAVQVQNSAETIFLRYFRAALDPNLMQATGASGPTAGAKDESRAMSRRGDGGNGGRHKMGSLKRMLTQKASGYGPGGINPELQPRFDDPYHQGYGVAAPDSLYGANQQRPSNLAAGYRHSGAESTYDNMHGVLGSTYSLTMSREHLTTPIVDGSNDKQQVRPLNHYLRLQTNGTTRGLGGAFGSSSLRQQHLYYHMPWPPEILTDIEQRLLHEGAALDPTLFSEALLYAYDVLDTYYFPIFIADAVSRNVTRDHCVLRVMLAFILLWFGFALPLALILLDSEPKAQRAWSVIPQVLGWWNMAVGFGGCDLLLALLRKYQSPSLKENNSKNGSSSAVKSHMGGWRRAWFSTRVSVDMTATRMVRGRSVRWFIGALVMTAVSTAILCSVPGTIIYKD